MKFSICMRVLFILYTFCLFKTITGQEAEINQLLDNWHQAAAVADEETFFGSMTPDAIYIGTDKTERWSAEELKKWSTEYFDRDTAWNFRPYDREIHFSADGKTAWFSELLETWMGICRGSGILERIGKDWKIRQYHLSVTIDNDKIKDFIKLSDTPDN
jgi:ketosteroid isomerase-like protein